MAAANWLLLWRASLLIWELKQYKYKAKSVGKVNKIKKKEKPNIIFP